MKISTKQKCQEILLKIVEHCNRLPAVNKLNGDPAVAFQDNFGGMTLTVLTPTTHAHIGTPDLDGTFEDLVDDLHEFFYGQ